MATRLFKLNTTPPAPTSRGQSNTRRPLMCPCPARRRTERPSYRVRRRGASAYAIRTPTAGLAAGPAPLIRDEIHCAPPVKRTKCRRTGSGARAGAARARGGTPTPARGAASTRVRAAKGRRESRTPRHADHHSTIRPRCSAIQSSCFGQPRPTNTTCAPDALMRATSSSSSSRVAGLNGGDYPPTICRPGNSTCTRAFSRRSGSGVPP